MNVSRKGVKIFIGVFVLLIAYNELVQCNIRSRQKEMDDILNKSAQRKDTLHQLIIDTANKPTDTL